MRELVIALTLAPPPAPPPAPLPATPACVQELTPLLQRQEFDALRVAAESCRRSTDHPRTWYYEGLAHLALGRPELAIFSLRKYVQNDAPDEPSRMRENAQARLEQARIQTALVELDIQPTSAELDTRVEIERADWQEPLAVFASELAGSDGRARLALPPGSYIFRAARAGLTPAQRAVTIDAVGDTVSVALSLRPRPPPPPPPPKKPQFPSRRWAGGWGGAGAAVLVIGAPMLAVGRSRIPDLRLNCSDSPQAIDRCRADLAASTMLFAGGGAVLGSGLGLMLGGLTGLAPRSDQRRKAWTAEAAVAGAAAVSGIILLGVAARSFNRINNTADPDVPAWGSDFRLSLLPSEKRLSAGAVLLGAGLGLGVSAVVGLVSPKFLGRSERAQRRWHVQPDGLLLKF